jgi:hypothetical protein
MSFSQLAVQSGNLPISVTRLKSGRFVPVTPPTDRPLTDYAQLIRGFWNIGEDVPIKRSQEDAACCQVLGVSAFRRYTIPDNIYRFHPLTGEPVVKENEDQFKSLVDPDESYLIPQVTDFNRKNLPGFFKLVAPLSIESHRVMS